MNEQSAKKSLLHKLTLNPDRKTTIIDEETGTFGVPHYDYNVKAIEAWKAFGLVEEVDVWFSHGLYVKISSLRLTDKGNTLLGWKKL